MYMNAKSLFISSVTLSFSFNISFQQSKTIPHPLTSGSSSTTRYLTACHLWRSHKSWREASCTAHTCLGKWHSVPIGPAAGQSSYLACWTSNPVSPYKWAICLCQSLDKKKRQKGNILIEQNCCSWTFLELQNMSRSQRLSSVSNSTLGFECFCVCV